MITRENEAEEYLSNPEKEKEKGKVAKVDMFVFLILWT